MKIKLIYTICLTLSLIINQNCIGAELKCEDEGCYEVIKTFAKLLEEKINETDKILVEAERELNEVTHGNDKNFQDKLNEIDHRLTMLIIDITTGIEGGEHTLFELINKVFKAVNDVEVSANQIELSIENGNKLTKIAEIEFNDVNDVIKKIQEEFYKLENQTETDLPKALQDAFDKSDKFQSETSELKDILDQMKKTLAEYEKNLLNAKDLTAQTIEKFAETSKQIDETAQTQREIESLFKEAADTKLPVQEYENYKKLSRDAYDKAKSVYDESLELLNEVSLLELNPRLDAIKKHVENLENYSSESENDLKKFADDNSDFLTKMEETIDEAENIQKKALNQMIELQKVLDESNDIHTLAVKSIDDKNDIISHARDIYKTLEDFNMKVEESKENARRALETIPEILQKITESVDIVEKLEEKVNKHEEIAENAKVKCTDAKNDMDKILNELDEIKIQIDALGDDLDTFFDDMKTVEEETIRQTDEHNSLKISEGETETIIINAKEKIETTKTRAQKVDENVNNALDDLKSLIEQIENMKNIDDKRVEDFEKSLEAFEDELQASELNEKLSKLKEQRQQQDELIEHYRVEIAFLEHQVNMIKENADSLENRCFKRTRLEP